MQKSDLVNCNMIQSMRNAAQLGDPPGKFCTDASELNNNNLKLKVNRKQQSLQVFVNHAKDLVGMYEKNIEWAFCRRGDWRLTDTLSSLQDISAQKKCFKKVLDTVRFEC